MPLLLWFRVKLALLVVVVLMVLLVVVVKLETLDLLAQLVPL